MIYVIIEIIIKIITQNKMKISIITAVKNGLPLLKSAIKSIKIQKKINEIEHIIVCAPSSDGTEDFLNSLSDVKVIFDKDSKTKFGSINKGINIATGDIIGLLHADDIFYDEYTLHNILKEFENKNDIVYGNVLFCHKEDISKIIREWISSDFKQNKLNFGWMPPHTSLFIKNEILKENLYEETFPISGDYLFILKIFNLKNLKIKFLDKYTTIMRDGGDSTKIKNLLKKLREDIGIAKKFFKFPYFVILMKIILKINQLKIFKKKLSNEYINNLNTLEKL